MSAAQNDREDRMLAATGVRPVTVARWAVTAFLATVLALSSTVSYAAFTASGTLSAPATTTGLKFTSTGMLGLSVQFTKKIKLVNSWVTFANTGTFPLIITSINVTNVGSEALGAETEFHVWSDSKCEKKAPGSAVETTLATGTTAIASSYGFSIPVGGSITLCTDLQFKGKLKNLAGHSVASTVSFTAAATSGAPSWTTTDLAAPVLAISVVGYEPSSVVCAASTGYVVGGVRYSSVLLTWQESTVQKPDYYEVWADTALVAILDDKIRYLEVNSSLISATGELEVTIVAVKDDVEYDSEVVYILSTAGAGARNITCS